MRRLTILLTAIVSLVASQSCGTSTAVSSLQKELTEYVADKDATIGIAVIVDRKDTIQVNGYRAFPMLSVYKFPIAVALGDYYRANDLLQPDSVTVTNGDLLPDTYSPLRDEYQGRGDFRMPLYDILAYALQQSDNNASDVLLKMVGGSDNVMAALRRLGIKDINVCSTEAEMHADNQLCYANTATPIAMARMLDYVDYEQDDAYSREVKRLMQTCRTGGDRLAKPLAGTNAVIGHKTGTGFTLPNGRLMAINDVGYVHLPGGRKYSIAVFIENSGYDQAQTESIIATISEIVYNHLSANWE